MLRLRAKNVKPRMDVTIGENIKFERETRGLTREELANMLEVTTAHMGLMERGERGATVVTLTRLSEIFDVSVDSLLSTSANRNLSLREPRRATEDERKKIASLITQLTESELGFLVQVIKGVVAMRGSEEE